MVFVCLFVISVVTMPVISERDARNFCSSKPSAEQISSLDRHELALMAQCLGIVLSRSSSKEELFNHVVSRLRVDTGNTVAKAKDSSMKELPLISEFATNVTLLEKPNLSECNVQLELAKIKLQIAKIEADKEIKLESVKLERIKLEHSERIRQGVSNTDSFDVSRHVKLVPPFNERNVDTYFCSFEKLSNALSWPR